MFQKKYDITLCMTHILFILYDYYIYIYLVMLPLFMYLNIQSLIRINNIKVICWVA